MADSHDHDHELDAFLEGLANDLIQAIGRTLNQSDQVQEVMDRIQHQGYQVGVVLAALTHVIRLQDEAADAAMEDDSVSRHAPASTSFDKFFLRQVGIKGDLPS